MQQPPQQIPIFVPYFNQPRVVQQEPQQQAPQHIIYSEQQPQHPQSVYPQVPLLSQAAPEQVVQQQEPVVQQQCPFARGACQRGRCCKRIDARKALKLFAVVPLVLYIINYFALLFHWAPYRYIGGSYFTLMLMAIISTVIAAAAIRKSSITLLGVFIGMTVFSLLAGVGSFIGAITVAFSSFMGFLVAASESIIGLCKIAGIIAAVKLLKKIRNEMSLPQFVEQQAQQEEEAPQAPVAAIQPVAQPVVAQQQEVAPQVAPMYPAFQQFQAPIIPVMPPSAPIAQQPVQQQQYATELKLLNDMGFTDAQKNMELLQKNNGSLQAVVMTYVQA